MTERRAQTTSWLAVAAITVAGIVAAFQIGKLPAALPALRAELGLSLVEAGWIISALAAVGVATGMVWGFVADRFGHRRMLLCGMAVIVLGTALGSFAETGTELFLTRLVEGCGYVTVLTAGPTAIGAFCRERDRPMALGLWAFYMPVGLAGMVVISPVMIEAASWRGLWQLNGLLALAAIALAAWATRGARGSREATSGGDTTPMLAAIRKTVSSPGPPTLAICFAAYSLVYISVAAFLPTFLIERQGYAHDSAAYWVAVAMVVNAPGCVLGGWLLRRGWPASRVIALAYLGMLVSTPGIFADDIDPALRLACAIFMPFIGGMIPPAVLARTGALAAAPGLASTCVGLVSQMLMLNQLIGPPILAALVAGLASWERANWLTIPMILLGLAAAWALSRIDRPARCFT